MLTTHSPAIRAAVTKAVWRELSSSLERAVEEEGESRSAAARESKPAPETVESLAAAAGGAAFSLFSAGERGPAPTLPANRRRAGRRRAGRRRAANRTKRGDRMMTLSFKTES
jgi:hypothetical protein